MKETIEERTAKYLLTQHPNKYEFRGQSLYRDGSRTTNVVKEVLDSDDLLDDLDLFLTVKRSGFDVKSYNSSVFNLIKDHVLSEKRKEVEKYLSKDVVHINASDFTLFKDIEETNEHQNKDKFLVHNSDSSIVTSMSVSAYKHLIGEEVFSNLKHNIPLARRVFDPYLINDTLNDKRWSEYCDDLYSDITCINECIHPKWRYNRDKTLKITDDELFFIESSFTSSNDLQYYIDAAYHTIIDKMWSYIMLYGIKGTGKTTLIEMIIPCVGTNNYRKAPQNALKKEFNGYKKNKRLVLMDEMVADTNAAINILKSDANKEFNVEEKSQVTESVKNFVSMWIATNNISDWKFTYDERRFSVLELTKETTLDRGISDTWMSEFSQRIESDEWAQAFFNYLEKNKSVNFNTMAPYRSEAFYKVVYESLTGWQMKIVDEILLGERVDEIKICNLYDEREKYHPETHKKIIDFLENYRHRGHKLGEYKRGKSVRASSIIPCDKYRAKINNNSDLVD